MRLNKVLKYNLKGVGLWLGVTLTMWLLLDLIIPLIFNLVTGQPRAHTLSLANSAMQHTTTLMVFLLWYSVINQGMTVFAQFNISRKTQYVGNLLMISFVAVLTAIIKLILYPSLLELVIKVKPISNKWVFINNSLLDSLAQIIYTSLILFSISLLAWFFVALIQRFSIKSVIMTTIILIISIPAIIVASADFVVEKIYPILDDIGYFINDNQWSVIVIVGAISLFLAIIVKLLTRKLSLK